MRRGCTCGRPAPAVEDGVAYCKTCGELLPDPRDELLKAVAVTVARLERQSRANGAATRKLARLPRKCVTREEAAECLAMSLNSFERHVQPDLELIRKGRMRLVPMAELDRWVEANMEPAL